MIGENKLTIRDAGIAELVAKIEKEWLGSKDFAKHQAGFCSQWLLDNSCKWLSLGSYIIHVALPCDSTKYPYFPHRRVFSLHPPPCPSLQNFLLSSICFFINFCFCHLPPPWNFHWPWERYEYFYGTAHYESCALSMTDYGSHWPKHFFSFSMSTSLFAVSCQVS